MKILYIITKSNWGGAQRHVYDVAVAMKDLGHTPIVALGGEGILRKRLEDAGIKTHVLSSLQRDISVSKDTSSAVEIFKIVRRERPDVLHLHSPKAAGLGALAGRMLSVKRIVVTVHGWSFNDSRPIWQRIFITFVSWLTILLAHKTIVISESEYNAGMRFPFVKGKISLVPLGIKPPIFVSIDGARMEITKHTGLTSADIGKKIMIGCIAEMIPNKGVIYLINAMEQIVNQYPSAIAVIIGNGDELSKMNMLIKEKKLENNIYLTGYVENAHEYIKAFNIFVLPSVKEGLPYVIMEAAYASLPIVATTVGGIPEMIEDMKSGVLVQSRNAKELAHAISFMIEHPAMRREYGNNARENMIKKFSFEAMISGISEVYTRP